MIKLLYLIPIHLVYFILFVFPVMLSSIFLVPLLYLINKEHLYKHPVYGNLEDGAYGDKPYQAKFSPSFISLYNWLVFRNPVHNYTHILLARTMSQLLLFRSRSDIVGYPVGDYYSGGYHLTLASTDSPISRILPIFEVYYIKPYRLFSKKLCIRIRIGYKLYFYIDKNVPNTNISMCPFVFSISPFHPYLGQFAS